MQTNVEGFDTVEGMILLFILKGKCLGVVSIGYLYFSGNFVMKY